MAQFQLTVVMIIILKKVIHFKSTELLQNPHLQCVRVDNKINHTVLEQCILRRYKNFMENFRKRTIYANISQ